MRTYYSWEQVTHRVDNLRRLGIWPGIRDHGDGTWSLTFDPAASPAATERAVADRLVHVSRIEPHPDNIRRDLGDLGELAASIQAAGLLQPLVVCVHPWRPGGYLLLAGHRRLAAAKRLRMEQVPVVVRPAPAEPEAIMLVENCQRVDLGPAEKAEAMGRLRAVGWAETRIARETGLSVSSVSRYLSLLELDQASLERIREGQVSVPAAVAAVQQTRAQARRRQGKPPRRASVAAEHFSSAHPLSLEARALCKSGSHGGRKYGGACGECWETAIRRDDRARAGAAR